MHTDYSSLPCASGKPPYCREPLQQVLAETMPRGAVESQAPAGIPQSAYLLTCILLSAAE